MKPETLHKVHSFLESDIEPKEFSRALRVLQDYAVRQALKHPEDACYVEDGYYYLTLFLEILDPKLSE